MLTMDAFLCRENEVSRIETNDLGALKSPLSEVGSHDASEEEQKHPEGAA